MSKFLKLLASAAIVTGAPAFAEGLGRVALPEEVAAWNTDIRPDGQGLPVGSGDAIVGEEIWTEKCAVCHGDFAEGVDRWPVLAGGDGTLASSNPVKTIGSYWPYLSTVYDYINRAMPFGNAGSLEPDEVYALTAYLLYSNDLIEDDFVLSNETFGDIVMPNVDNFFMDDRAETELPIFAAEACMTNCKDSVEVTKRAAVIDVTPEGGGTGIDLESGGGSETVAPAATEAAPADEPAAVEEAALNMELVAQGEKDFRQCKSCHQVGDGAKNRTGPVLNGVVERTAGTVDGFRYSNDMVDAGAAGLVWTEVELAAFLANPKDYMSGTKMSFRGVRDEEEIAGLIEYLKSFPE
ncbi:MAG: c-type cytochrome [Yoonia sp.]|nr:c-type cytochrome [Yoonia sp.]